MSDLDDLEEITDRFKMEIGHKSNMPGKHRAKLRVNAIAFLRRGGRKGHPSARRPRPPITLAPIGGSRS